MGLKPKVSQLRELIAVVNREKADIGIFISLQEPTKNMKEEAIIEGFYESGSGNRHHKIQLLTIEDLLAGKTIDIPNYTPYHKQAERTIKEGLQVDLL
jgi:hypothetical protein